MRCIVSCGILRCYRRSTYTFANIFPAVKYACFHIQYVQKFVKVLDSLKKRKRVYETGNKGLCVCDCCSCM